MATRTRRNFSDFDKKDLLNELEKWRNKCIAVCTKAPINTEVYGLANKLIADIDSAVEILTGDLKHLHAKRHSNN